MTMTSGFRRWTLRGHTAELGARDVFAEIEGRAAVRAEALALAEKHPPANPYRVGAPDEPATPRQRAYLGVLERQWDVRLPPLSRRGASQVITLLEAWR